MYPNNNTSLILGKSLFREDHNLFLYCPHDIHTRMAHTIPLDLDLASIGLTSAVKTVDNLDHLSSMDYVIFPMLDVLPNKRRFDFADTLKDLFRLAKPSKLNRGYYLEKITKFPDTTPSPTQKNCETHYSRERKLHVTSLYDLTTCSMNIVTG